MNGKYRALTAEEIQVLTQNGCRAEDWNRVAVSEGFCPDRVSEVYFGGTVRLGSNRGSIQGRNRSVVPAGFIGLRCIIVRWAMTV